MDDFCQKCCRCCAVPKISIMLSVATAVMYGLIYFTWVIGQKEPVGDCECGSFECCRIDVHLCGEDRCYCENVWSGAEDGYCEEREEELKGAAAIFAALFWLAGWALLITSFSSCCCFGHCQEEEAPHMSGRVTGIPVTKQPPPMSTGLVGIPVSNEPPRVTGVPMMTTRPVIMGGIAPN